VVTRTFTSSVPITIPDSGPATPYPSTIQVGGLRQAKVLDVNVTLTGFSHAHPGDIEVILVDPKGEAAVVLMSEVGGSDDISNVTLVFDDQAASFLPFEQPIVSGTYKPTLPAVGPSPETATLRSFTGLNPNGAGRLYVADGAGGDTGSVAGWALTIKARARA
jgi:subtilisin-like proprotein convertase family protein